MVNEPPDDGVFSPELTESEAAKVEERAAVGAHVVYEAVRREGEEELARPSSALAWSGLAAGLSMGFSLVAQGLLRAGLPDAPWRPLVANLGYSVGFLIVILGRQQLFTENTLTVILPLLARRNRRTLGGVARLWAIVLVANLVGAAAFALVAARSDVFPAHVRDTFAALARESLGAGFWGTALRAVFAGWLIALTVWMLPGSQRERVPVILIVTWLVGLGAFSHIIAGSVDTAFLVWRGELPVGAFFTRFFLPTLLGNVAGGTALVAALNHAQVAAGHRSRTRELASSLWGRVRRPRPRPPLRPQHA